MGKKQAISFRIEEEKISQLDELAEVLKRDRTFLINDAIEAYLEVQQWHIKHIKNAIRQADKNDFASQKDIDEAFKKWQS